MINIILQNISEAIDKSGLTSAEIANQIGVTPSNFTRLLKAKDIKISTMIKIANVLDISVLSFFQEEIATEEGRKIIRDVFRKQGKEIELLKDQIKLMNFRLELEEDYKKLTGRIDKLLGL